MSIVITPRPEPADDAAPPAATSPSRASAPGTHAEHASAGCPRCRSTRPGVRRVIETTENGTHVIRVICSDAWHGGVDPVIRVR